ncbi:MAG: lipoprotein [Pseudomonadota bacterium]
MKKMLLYLLLLLPLAGCAAPIEIHSGQKVKAQALASYLANDAKVDNVVIGLWKAAREKEIAKTAETATQKVVAIVGKDRATIGPDGKPGPMEKTLTAAEAIELSTVIHANIQAANAGTDRVVAKIKVLRDLNARNLAQYAELESAINQYLQAGIDESALTELTGYLVETINTKLNKEK